MIIEGGGIEISFVSLDVSVFQLSEKMATFNLSFFKETTSEKSQNSEARRAELL